MSRLLSTSTRLSSSMYSHTRLYKFCMLSGADQKNSGVSSTCGKPVQILALS